MNTEIQNWLMKAKEGIEQNTKKQWPETPLNHNTIRWSEGRRYIKVIITDMNGERGSAYCFVDLDGNIYMPAGFNKPANGIRGTIKTIDPSKLSSSTGWLYCR